MTPRERAIESLTLLRQNASKRNATYSQCFLDDMADVIEQAIIADQQALQSEMKQKIDEYSSDLPSVKERMLHIVQVVFAQQSQPEELKPERLMISQEEFNRCIKQANENYREAERRYQACYTELTKTQAESDRRVFAQQSQPEEPNPDMISKSACDRLSAERIEKVLAESDRRVLAEREACAKICDAYEVYCKSAFPVIHKPMEFGIAVSVGLAHNIRARSNQPEEKPSTINTGPVPKEWMEESKRVERMISSADRIATLQEWLAKDAQTIEQLNASNQKLSEENFALREKVRRLERDHFGGILAASERDRQKIAQLEKEKNELEIKERERRETRSDWHTHFCDKPGCETTACERPTKYLSASRKA